MKDPGQRILILKLQAPPDLKIGPNKSKIQIINDQNVGIKIEVILILQIWNVLFSRP